MANITTDQNYPNVKLMIMDSSVPPRPAMVDGIPMWASSDATILTVVASADGMSAIVDTVAPGVARITVSADADVGAGVIPITGVSDDVIVSMGTKGLASVMSLDLGASADKP